MIHVVFQTADVAVLQKAIGLDESLAGDVLEIKDDFAVGPLDSLDTEEGWTSRADWWHGLVAGSPYAGDNPAGAFDDRKTVAAIVERLEADDKEEVWIWMGQNQHDVCGYYWLISQLKDWQGRIVVLYFNNLPFINEKGLIFYPATLHEIQPKEFLKAKKLNRKVTPSELEVDPDEWKRLAAENAFIRILEGGKKIAGKEAHFYDGDVIAGLNSEWQKGHRAMTAILGKMKIKTGDVFMLWRMRQLEAEGRIEINCATSKGWKDFEVRIKAAAAETIPANTEPS